MLLYMLELSSWKALEAGSEIKRKLCILPLIKRQNLDKTGAFLKEQNEKGTHGSSTNIKRRTVGHPSAV